MAIRIVGWAEVRHLVGQLRLVVFPVVAWVSFLGFITVRAAAGRRQRL